MGPAFAEIRVFLRRLAGKMTNTAVQRLTPSFVFTRRAKRVRAAFAEAHTVGFVCYGNICRSPFAGVYAASVYSDKSFWSSGFHEVSGRGTPHIGVEVARGMGVDLENWLSTRLIGPMVEGADLILIFDEKNRVRFQEQFPDAKHKVFFLADVLAAREREIEDPYGGSEKDFRRTYLTIRQSVDALRPDASGTG
jgi:protein-tyrosine phosphatase